jgi:AraC-like DNA-binding protein
VYAWKTIILLLAAGQGSLLSFALFTPRRKSSISNVFLGLIILVLSLELLNDWGLQVKYHSDPDAIPFWILGSYLIIPPALWFFMQVNTNPGYRFKKIHLIAFVPAFIEIIAEGLNRPTGFVYSHLLKSDVWFFFTEAVPPVATAVVLAIYGINLFKLRKHHAVSYSSAMTFQHIKLYGLHLAFTLLVVLWISEVFFLLPVFSYVEFLLVAFIFTLGYVGYFQPDFFNIPGFAKIKTEQSGFSRYSDETALQNLERVFTEQKLHLQPKLALEELAAQLKLPDRYVSYLINEYHKTNFHNYVNRWRVREVIEKINNPAEQHKTLLALALESGFNSKSSFNQIFKSHTGRTPSELLQPR